MVWEQNERMERELILVLQKEQQIINLLEGINVSSITQSLAKIQISQAALATTIAELTTALESAISGVATSQSQCCEKILAGINQIVAALIPPPAVSFTAVITNNSQGANMAASAKATADLQVQDNGTFTVSLYFLDALNVRTTTPAGLSAVYTASDATPGPSSLTLVPSADTSSAAGSINQTTIAALVAAGTALPVGLSISITATWTGLAAPLTVVASPLIDVVPGPAASFVASETTP